MKYTKDLALILPISLLITGCATDIAVTPKAATIQVHTQVSTLLSNCKNLGAVTGVGDNFDYYIASAQAKNQIREASSDKGADTVVILNTDRGDGLKLIMQGTALRCY